MLVYKNISIHMNIHYCCEYSSLGYVCIFIFIFIISLFNRFVHQIYSIYLLYIILFIPMYDAMCASNLVKLQTNNFYIVYVYEYSTHTRRVLVILVFSCISYSIVVYLRSYRSTSCWVLKIYIPTN